MHMLKTMLSDVRKLNIISSTFFLKNCKLISQFQPDKTLFHRLTKFSMTFIPVHCADISLKRNLSRSYQPQKR